MLRLLFSLLLAALMSAFARAWGYDIDEEMYDTFASASAAAEAAAASGSSSFNIFTPLVWLWGCLPTFFITGSVFLFLAGFVWSPRGSHVAEAVLAIPLLFVQILRDLIPLLIDTRRVERAQRAAAVVKDREVRRRRTAERNCEALAKEVERLRGKLAEAEVPSLGDEEPKNPNVEFAELQAAIATLERRLRFAQADHGTLADAATIRECHGRIAELEAAAAAQQTAFERQKRRLNEERLEQLGRLRKEATERTAAHKAEITARDKKLAVFDSIKEVLHQLVEMPEGYRLGVSLAMILALRGQDLVELDIEEQKLRLLFDCVQKGVAPTASQLGFRRHNWNGRVIFFDQQAQYYEQHQKMIAQENWLLGLQQREIQLVDYIFQQDAKLRELQQATGVERTPHSNLFSGAASTPQTPTPAGKSLLERMTPKTAAELEAEKAPAPAPATTLFAPSKMPGTFGTGASTTAVFAEGKKPGTFGTGASTTAVFAQGKKPGTFGTGSSSTSKGGVGKGYRSSPY
ncbi:hypothetical protein K505DRAFT_337910 [Melanomma pulvis-pyrius CBS 109.77]|uniref:Uncharacterized protein n=1 Tax=Melanomma pulvis-pyrius CBS 109.77 TaxID=1314802 RepID=A0A6A6XA48_9PLEO|nr:hypothetical protein K505DRAFT_337910 [Melanomma pulvis-pyrius CBS 109.77]